MATREKVMANAPVVTPTEIQPLSYSNVASDDRTTEPQEQVMAVYAVPDGFESDELLSCTESDELLSCTSFDSSSNDFSPIVCENRNIVCENIDVLEIGDSLNLDCPLPPPISPPLNDMETTQIGEVAVAHQVLFNETKSEIENGSDQRLSPLHAQGEETRILTKNGRDNMLSPNQSKETRITPVAHQVPFNETRSETAYGLDQRLSPLHAQSEETSIGTGNGRAHMINTQQNGSEIVSEVKLRPERVVRVDSGVRGDSQSEETRVRRDSVLQKLLCESCPSKALKKWENVCTRRSLPLTHFIVPRNLLPFQISFHEFQNIWILKLHTDQKAVQDTRSATGVSTKKGLEILKFATENEAKQAALAFTPPTMHTFSASPNCFFCNVPFSFINRPCHCRLVIASTIVAG